MKIDLRKSKGILEPLPFTVSGEAPVSAASDDEIIIETLKKRHGDVGSEPESDKEKSEQVQARKERSAIPILLIILILTVAGGSYMLDTIGVLRPGVQVIENYWRSMLGLPVVQVTEQIRDDYIPEYAIRDKQILSEDEFLELMPVTEDLAALADSLAAIPDDSLVAYVYEDDEQSEDTSRNDSITITIENLPPLSDDDIIILNNRSLMLLLIELVQNYPEDLLDGHLFLKRDALRLSAPTGGNWVDSMQVVMDKFVLGSYKADYSSGKVEITSKFSLIMARERDFQANILDGLRMLDVLANPYSDYLTEIAIDLSKGVDNNPAEITFTGSAQEMQYILTAWAESRTNFLLRSIDIKFRGSESLLSFDILLFDYQP